MKKQFLFAAAICAVMLTGCSSSSSYDSGAALSERDYSDSANEGIFQYAPAAFSKSNDDLNGEYYAETTTASYEPEYYDDYTDEYGNTVTTAPSFEEDYKAETAIETAEAEEDNSEADNPQNSAEETIKKDMLVYYCTMEVDTLDFESALNSFRSTLDMYGGFIEQENYSDGGGSGRWYYDNSEKWQSYTATLRVPSRNYEDFCNSAGELGDLRSKNARVENVSQEYSDLSTTLEIYEAKEERYIALLANITEDEYAVAIERELTDIQIQIANIRTRMNAIRTDVAYSYVYITINEVKEYTAEPIKTDTFLDRLSVTLKDAGSGFLDFLERLLFMIIYLVPYLVLIGIIVLVIIALVKKSKKRREKKRAETHSEKETKPAETAEQSFTEAELKEDKQDTE